MHIVKFICMEHNACTTDKWWGLASAMRVNYSPIHHTKPGHFVGIDSCIPITKKHRVAWDWCRLLNVPPTGTKRLNCAGCGVSYFFAKISHCDHHMPQPWKYIRDNICSPRHVGHNFRAVLSTGCTWHCHVEHRMYMFFKVLHGGRALRSHPKQEGQAVLGSRRCDHLERHTAGAVFFLFGCISFSTWAGKRGTVASVCKGFNMYLCQN